ncbi:hypothetical protein [Ferruginivarius sediminum]|uniref:Uncharacterized protein n=1 Tax=Ferruginivarius sediminum TaxID=2661937 RepID=A0A369TJ18_9PROT|nr:hypothetical protein [Ferruginivarius sediminum]RDD62886.1 hypothetical protein DRB17_06935 [Ferruginivarius sediminum]
MFRWLTGRLRPNDAELQRLYRAWREAGEAYRLHREEFDAFEGARSDVADHLQRALEADESRMSEIESRMAAVTPDSHHGARLQALVLQREFEAAPGRSNGPFANETMALLAQRLTEYILRRRRW